MSGSRRSAATPQAGRTVARVLVIESSDGARRQLVEWIEAEPGLEVVADAASGAEAMALLGRVRADIVFVNGPLPRPDAYETTRRIMTDLPRPIVIGTVAASDDGTAFRSLEAGAVACIPDPLRTPGAAAGDWLRTLKAMAEVKVVTRRGRGSDRLRPTQSGRVQMVAIGASTGGPIVLQQILAALPQGFSAPLLVVQHIARGFLPGMAEWLRQTVGLRVQIAAHGMQPLAGHVYLAPDDFELGLATDGSLALCRPDAPGGSCPSVAHLFRSLSDRLGPAVVGVLLTGMGKDGAAELRLMRERGAVTIAQDRASSVVHGMPGEAIALDGATHVLPADRIAAVLTELVCAGPADASWMAPRQEDGPAAA